MKNYVISSLLMASFISSTFAEDNTIQITGHLDNPQAIYVLGDTTPEKTISLVEACRDYSEYEECAHVKVVRGNFDRTESGFVEWTVDMDKKHGQIQLTSNSTGILNKTLSFSDQATVFTTLGWMWGAGTSTSKKMNFDSSDENSSQTVKEYIKNKLNAGMARLKVDVVGDVIVLENQSCERSGIFKKTLTCQARYNAELSVNLLN